MNCKKCRYELFKGFKFCYECGEKVDEESGDCRKANNYSKLKCLECNSILINDAKFCHNCKKEVDVKMPVRKKDALGWISIVVAFVWPWGTVMACILSIFLLTRKEQNKNLALIGLVFSSAILILFFVIMPLL